MVNIDLNFTPEQQTAILAVAALVYAVKFAGWLTDRFAPIAAVLGAFAVLSLATFAPEIGQLVNLSAVIGAVASGTFAAVKKVVNNKPNDEGNA